MLFPQNAMEQNILYNAQQSDGWIDRHTFGNSNLER